MKSIPIDFYFLSLISRFQKLARTEEDIEEFKRFLDYINYLIM